jgi:transcription-repair coupling factor (superfamily II helicase)
VNEAKQSAGQAATLHAQRWTPQINLGMAVLIPESYVQELGLRLNLYRRAAELEDKPSLEAFAAELIDRFGPMPVEVQNLIGTLNLKQLCRAAGIEKVDAGDKGVVIAFRNNSFAKPDKLIAYLQKHSNIMRLRPDQKIAILRAWNDPAARIKGLAGFISEMAGL